MGKLTELADNASLHPDLRRALRATVAFMVPLLFALAGSLPVEASFAAIAAQNIALVDLRGDYRLRFALVLSMAAVLVGSAALGASVSENLYVALAATAFMAIGGGIWRHLSVDYGPPLAISSSFVFLFALSAPNGAGTIGPHALAVFAGAAWGVVLRIADWPFRPQHALRRTIADSWLAVADLVAAITPDDSVGKDPRAERVVQAEANLRATLDAAYATLDAMRPSVLRPRLEALNLTAARLATRVMSLHTALEPIAAAPAFTAIAPVLEPVLTSLTNLSRGTAVAVVSRQPSHLATFEIRLRRVTSLLGVLRTRVAAHAQLGEIIRHIEEQLAAVHAALRATIERADEPVASSLELLDLRTRALRPLAAALNLNLHVDPALVRYTLRLAVLTMAGVAIFKSYALPHGYWLPFTIVVVLQPDYGSTRQRAAQRVLGTLAGTVVAGALHWLQLPTALLMTATAGTMFGFGYWLKRNYAIAIFFITLFIVLLTGATEPVTIAFTIERITSTLAGGALALLAAQLFWPVWERDRFSPLLARAFRANREYLRILIDRLVGGGRFEAEAIGLKRRVESANSAAFSSLRRMTGDPQNQRDSLEFAAILANGNQRLTRALNGLTLQIVPGATLEDQGFARFTAVAGDALEALAASVEHGVAPPAATERLLVALGGDFFPHLPATERERFIIAQLQRATTELSALLLALQDEAPARSDDALHG